MENLTFNNFPVFVLEVTGKDRGKCLIFPTEIYTDLVEGKIYIKCQHGLIPREDLRLPNIMDRQWISSAFDMSIFQIKRVERLKISCKEGE